MWILPSLGRPERAQKVAETAPDAPILLRLHWGDKRLDDYQSIKWPKAWKVAVHPKQSLTDSLNWALETYPAERNYGFLADDTIPSPDGWWETLEKAAENRYIAYPDDGVHGKELCTHHCIGGDLMRAVGWWALPGLVHSFLDTVWYTIGYNTDLLRYVPEVRFDHLHPINKKSEMDDTYVFGQSHFKSDADIFNYWAKTGSGADIIGKVSKIFPKIDNSP